MTDTANYRRNTRILRLFSLMYLGLTAVALVLVHAGFYEPAVSYLLVYLTVAVGVTLSGVILLLPEDMFTDQSCAGAYATFAVLIGLTVFFTGGVSSPIYVLYFPLLLSAALHGVRRIALVALAATLFVYFIVAMPDLLSGQGDEAGLALFRLGVFALLGGFVLATSRQVVGADGFEEYATDEDGSMLLEVVSGEISAARGGQVAVILVDPGRGIGNTELLFDRIRERIAEPILLGEGNVFGMVLSGADQHSVESAAGRALAVAQSLGARNSLAGAAIYPRDARSAGDLLAAAGSALEAAFEPDGPSVMLAGRTAQNDYRAAR
ncbi:hypothetical protein BH23ACT11_BH23ACT11_29470 [soil metagenome]